MRPCPKQHARVVTLWTTAIFLLCAGSTGARPLAQVRISSLEAVLADTTTVAAAAGQPGRGEDLLLSLLGSFGIRDLSILDATRPLAAVLPVEGILLQQRGVVVEDTPAGPRWKRQG